MAPWRLRYITVIIIIHADLVHTCICYMYRHTLTICSSLSIQLQQEPVALVSTGYSGSALTLEDSFISIESVPLDVSMDESHPTETEESSTVATEEDDLDVTEDEEDAEMDDDGSSASTIATEKRSNSIDPEPQWTGYVIVGDNVDKNVRRSFQRVDYQTQSLHYFNAYAVLNRVDFSGLPDEAPCTVVDPKSILPTSDDVKVLEKDFQVLISR